MMNKNYTGAGLIAISIILFWVFALPFYNRISDLDAAIQERTDLITSRGAIMANINNLNKEYQKRIPEIAKLSTIVPAKKSIAEVLSTIDNISAKNGIELFSSSIISPISSDVSTNLYGRLNIEMGLSGSYPALTNFLSAFERSLRLVDILSVDVTGTSLTNTSLLNFNIKGTAYYLK